MSDYRGRCAGAGKRVALVVSRFNEAITKRLVDGACAELERLGVDVDAVDRYEVPGAFDLPAVARRVATGGKYDAIVCLGAVVRGATPHFEYVASEATKGVAAVAQEATCAVTFGVLTCDAESQAWERAGGKAGNRGADAAKAALELADLYSQIG